MVGENLLSSEQPPSQLDEADVVNVTFPYPPSPTNTQEPPVKIDYAAKEIPSPKKTLNIRRSGLKTRLVRIDNSFLEDAVMPEAVEPSPITRVEEEKHSTHASSKTSDLPGTLNKLLKTVGDIGLATHENQRQCALIASGLDKQAGIVPKIDALQKHFEQSHKIETANQRLFDAMHGELKGYKDNFLFDALQKPVIRDLLALFDDLCGQARRTAAFLVGHKESSEEKLAWKAELQASHDNINNTVFFIIEVLNRLDVTMMEGGSEMLDLKIHKVVGFEPSSEPNDKNSIARVVRPGFFWKDRVLRPTEVIVKKYSETSENVAA